jgi:hypothetical protein
MAESPGPAPWLRETQKLQLSIPPAPGTACVCAVAVLVDLMFRNTLQMRVMR